MNLTQVLHARWGASASLNAILPVEHVYTGRTGETARPWVRIAKVTACPAARFNDGARTEKVAVRFELVDDDYEHALAVVAQVVATFDRTSFDLAGSERVLAMHNTEQDQEQQADGAWQMTVDFECTVLRT